MRDVGSVGGAGKCRGLLLLHTCSGLNVKTAQPMEGLWRGADGGALDL